MEDNTFIQLQKIAKEMFGCTIVPSDKPLNLKEIFGFDEEDLKKLQQQEELKNDKGQCSETSQKPL